MDCNTTTLLIADPDADSRSFLADNLTADGFEVLTAATAFSARRLVRTSIVDLLVTDVEFPDGGGLELVRAVREAGSLGSRVDQTMPILVLGPGGEEIRLRAFARGADDFVPRPYSYAELAARLHALVRRCRLRSAPPTRIRIGPLEIDAVARQAWLHREPVDLSTKEFSLLHLLAGEPGRVFTREELMRAVWGWEGHFGSRTLDSHASRLRRKLSGGEDRFVVNVWGVGYRLLTAVSAASLGGPAPIDIAA